MFIYKGRIYRKRDWWKNGLCEGCDIWKDNDCGFLNEDVAPDCGCYSLKELFISRLFHAILEVFYPREIKETGK